MSVVGYTIFGRPVQHEYVSNGLFNEHNLNNESYLSDRIELRKGQSFAIFKRFKDPNDIEITTIFLTTYAVSFNERAGGFVGAGIAFVGKPSTKLIYHRLKHIHQQSLALVNNNDYKFINPKIEEDQIKLPDLSEDGLFVSRTPKKYVARDMAIGVKIMGNFYENLMGAIQGFCFNENYYAVKTAYVSNSDDLLRNLVPSKSIYQLHNLLDFQNVYIKYNKRLNEIKKKVDEDINKKRQDFIKDKEEIERRLKVRDNNLRDEKERLRLRENEIRALEKNEKDLENQIKSYENDEFQLKKNIQDLETQKRKLNSQQEIIKKDIRDINKKGFEQTLNLYSEEKKLYEEKIINDYKKEQEKNRKKPWLKFFLVFTTIIFIILSSVLSYFLDRNNNKLNIKINELGEKKTEIRRLDEQGKLKDIPKELTANEFLKLENKEKEEHKSKIRDAVDLISNKSDIDRYDKIIDNLNTREWNFREILNENEPNDIKVGWDVLDKLKNQSKANNNDLLQEPLFLIPELRNRERDIVEKIIRIDENADGESILKEYLKLNNNIYHKLNIEYSKPDDEETFQDSDPIFLMHFRWMVYKYKNQDKNIYKLEKIDSIAVPVLK